MTRKSKAKPPANRKSAEAGRSKKTSTEAKPAKPTKAKPPKLAATRSAQPKAQPKAKSAKAKSAKAKSAKAKSAKAKPTQKPPQTKPAQARADTPKRKAASSAAVRTATKPLHNYVVVILDSCRFDSLVAAKPKTLTKLGALEKRWSYASWTAPSHYNLLTGLMPHSSPKNVYASEYYKKDFHKYSERLGLEGTSFRSLIPHLYFPIYLRSIGYHTHARVSLPVLNPRTVLNNGFDTYKLMNKHNDMRSMFETMRFSRDKPSFFLLNVGETHYPYALPNEPPEDWPRISGIHGVFKHLDDHIVGGQVIEDETRFFDDKKLRALRHRQIDAVRYIDRVVEEMFDLLPANTYVTITADHGELFGEGGYFGHGPIAHDKVFEVPFVEGMLR